MELKKELFNTLEQLSPRDEVDFFEDESTSLLILDLLLNQRQGVERATSANMAIHCHYGEIDFKNAKISDTRFPYKDIELRRPAKSLYNMLLKYIGKESAKLNSLTHSEIGALASLERYYNRQNGLFDPIRKIELSASQIRKLTLDSFFDITGLNFPKDYLLKQLESVACILDIKKNNVIPKRSELKKLDRVGDETADTLLVYVFHQKALILDQYLRRILYRHKIIDEEKWSRTKILKEVESMSSTHEKSHKLHARANEIGVQFCFSQKPNCKACPLYKYLPKDSFF